LTPKLFGGGNWELYDADPKQNDPHRLPCIVLGLPSEHRNIGAGTGGEPESTDILRANRRPPVRRVRHLQDRDHTRSGILARVASFTHRAVRKSNSIKLRV